MPAGASEDVLTGFGALYSELVQPNRAVRASFLAKLLQPFDSACNLHSPAAAPTNLRYLYLAWDVHKGTFVHALTSLQLTYPMAHAIIHLVLPRISGWAMS